MRKQLESKIKQNQRNKTVSRVNTEKNIKINKELLD